MDYNKQLNDFKKELPISKDRVYISTNHISIIKALKKIWNWFKK